MAESRAVCPTCYKGPRAVVLKQSAIFPQHFSDPAELQRKIPPRDPDARTDPMRFFDFFPFRISVFFLYRKIAA
jgi:hypothetical protein